MPVRTPTVLLLLQVIALTACSAIVSAHADSARASAEPVEQPVDAIWHTQQLEFEYSSSSIYYSPLALQQKISAILERLGARRGVIVELLAPASAPLRFAQARITLSTPIAATPENIASATHFTTRHELIARLHGLQLPSATDIERFPVAWRTVMLTRDRTLSLDAGDCDLLNGIRRQILPKIGAQVQDLSCSPLGRRMRPRAEVMTLMPLERQTVAHSWVRPHPTLPPSYGIP